MALSHIIVSNMVFLPKKEISDRQIAHLKSQLTIYNRFNTDDVLTLFDDTHGDYFGVPLYFYKDLVIMKYHSLKKYQVNPRPT